MIVFGQLDTVLRTTVTTLHVLTSMIHTLLNVFENFIVKFN